MFALVDGCIAVASAKTHLDKKELLDSLDAFASIPQQRPLAEHKPMPLLQVPSYENWPFRVIYATSAISSDTLHQHIVDYYSSHPEIPINRRVDLVHVLGDYHFIRVGETGAQTANGLSVAPHSFHRGPPKVDSYPFVYAIDKVTAIASATKFIAYDFHLLLEKVGSVAQGRLRSMLAEFTAQIIDSSHHFH